MMSHGSHYRVEEAEGDLAHVTYDCGVAELRVACVGADDTCPGGGVELLRVGTLKDILVFNYVDLNIVLMVVSWVSKHSELEPRLRRDDHGFWLANLAATPRCTEDPYILPELASQVAPAPTKGSSSRRFMLCMKGPFWSFLTGMYVLLAMCDCTFCILIDWWVHVAGVFCSRQDNAWVECGAAERG